MKETTETAMSLLLSLIYPLHEGMMSPEQLAALSLAAQVQAKSAGEDALPVKSRSVGDVSVSYDTAGTPGAVTVNGRSIAPEAAAILKNAGLLCRWV